MKVAIPLYGSRVSPRFAYSRAMLVAELAAGQPRLQHILTMEHATDSQWLDRLSALRVDLFICGAADARFLEEAKRLAIRVVADVAGEIDHVLAELAEGRLQPGYGTYADHAGGLRDDGLDCPRCKDRACLVGQPCPGLVPDLHCRRPEPGETELLKTTTEIGCAAGPKLCRVTEFIRFCQKMDYEHVGVAFCVELYRETQILVQLLRRYFQVTPVCCKIGGQRVPEDQVSSTTSPIACNPVGQAAELNRRGTQINAIVGLCMGCDLVFTQRSRGPVTTLLVKDQSLANNPLGALLSSQSLGEEPGPGDPFGG